MIIIENRGPIKQAVFVEVFATLYHVPNSLAKNHYNSKSQRCKIVNEK
jgi:hypothetical protein